MTSPCPTPIDLESTSYYHSIAHWVRRALLCGADSPTGNSYEHRKLWVVHRLKEWRVFSLLKSAHIRC